MNSILILKKYLPCSFIVTSSFNCSNWWFNILYFCFKSWTSSWASIKFLEYIFLSALTDSYNFYINYKKKFLIIFAYLLHVLNVIFNVIKITCCSQSFFSVSMIFLLLSINCKLLIFNSSSLLSCISLICEISTTFKSLSFSSE